MSSNSMASASVPSTDSASSASKPKQPSPIYDLYGLVGAVSPNATEAQIREAYKNIVKKLSPQLPSKAVSTP